MIACAAFLDFSPRARCLRPAAIKRDELADQAARLGAIVGRARPGEGDVHFRNSRLARDRDHLPRRDADDADQEHRAEQHADNPERFGPGEQPFDEVGRPQTQGERDEPAEPRPGETRKGEARAGDEAGFLRRLDLELSFVDRRRRDCGGSARVASG